MAVEAGTPIGRDVEVGIAVGALRADPGTPRLVLIRGEAGIGKTTVFESVTGIVRPDISVRAAEMERELPYGALADLIGAVLHDTLPALHPVRAVALRAALHLGDPGLASPDGRAVALATQDVLANLVERGPITLAIDDVQWLDQETAACLAFAIRRLADRGLGVLLAMRTGPASGLPLGLAGQLANVTVIEIEPLAAGPLGAVLTEGLHRSLPHPTVARIHEMSRGNPLLALELARTLPDDAGPDDLPTTPDVERLIGRRVRDLPRDTIELLLLAAASGRPTIDLLAAATSTSTHECAGRLGTEAADGLVEIDNGTVRFAHPLFTSAVLRSVSPGARVDAHRRLALLTDGAERAFHLGEAASGPDEDVAIAIEVAAEDAARRSAPASAASLLERAAALSPALEAAGRRRLSAARLHALAGDGGRARRLNERVATEMPPGPIRAQARAELFTPAVTDEDVASAVAEADDDDAACATIWWVFAQCAFLRLDLPGSVAAAEKAAIHAERAGDTRTLVSAMVQVGWIRNLWSPGSGLGALRAADALPWSAAHAYDSAATKIAMNQTAMDDFPSARATLHALAESCRATGDEASLVGIALHAVELEARAGDLPGARAWIRVRSEVAAGDGEWQSSHIHDYLEALVLGREGDGEGAVTASLRGLRAAAATDDGAFAVLLLHTAAVGHLLCGRPREALDLLTSARASCESAGLGEPGVIRFHGPEIEALVGVGDRDMARARIAELDALGRNLARPRLVGEAAFGRGLLLGSEQDHAAAIVALTEAVDTFDGAGLPWERERARLELGIAMRRARQRRDARDTLDAVEAGFVSMGADGWAARAAQERERISGRAASSGELTPIETQVADLVASGLPNKQVAAQLFLSPKTVESHLSHIYAKTGVRSRTELAALLMRGSASPAP